MAKKKKFAVYPRTKEAQKFGLDTGKGHRSFRGKTVMNISDPAEATEIEDKYGKHGTQDAYVVEDERYAHAVNGERWDMNGTEVKPLHHYVFGPTQSYSEAWDDFMQRRKDKPTRRRSVARKGAEVTNG